MSNFTFGAPTTTAATQSFGFGTPQTTTAFNTGGLATTGTSWQAPPQTTQIGTPNFGFGTNTASGIGQTGFGTGLTSTPGMFSANPPQPQAAQLSQGIQLSQPAQASTLSFGAPAAQPAALALGSTQQTTGLTFAAPAFQPAGLTPGLGHTTGLSFGTPTSQPTGLTSGTLGQNTGLTFGTPSSQSSGLTTSALGQTSGLTFGTSTAKPAGLTFGTPNTQASAPTLTSTSAPGGLSTGGVTAGALTSGITATTASSASGGGLTFGVPSTTGGLTFGATTTSTSTGSLGATTIAGGLTFGTSSTSAAPTSSTLTFGLATTSTAPPLFGATSTGLFGAKPTTTTAAPTVVTTSTSKGLGGLDVSVTNKGLAQGTTSPTASKENLLPNELMQTIDSFKEFVKTQKVLSSDIARGSARPLNRCAEDTASLMEILTTLAGSLQRDRSLTDKLKQDTAKALQNAEIAQRTHDTPAGLQYENNAPLLFFMELSENFEQDLMLFKSQIESTEKHIQTMMSPKTLTPQELTMAMSKLHESLVAVAGKLQGVHSKVQQQKEQYLNFRKYVLKDSSNVFEDIKADGKSVRSSFGKVTSGPTPFGPGNRSFLSSTNLNPVQTPSYGSSNSLASWGNVASSPASNISINKPPTSGLNFTAPTNLTAPLSTTDPNSSFQLQKPPLGNKRGKH
ncbi:hypothetical protein QAD02_015450 [Eretmocerus hayati]|uniref:Uncharacterized protein n=1 Tax=Eretmocerus hayati TaxID=131215 RepID=A0ACC2P988_9HYME|nr:hypothetical protein QAD02_015450 [Eretmocerus hayati]